MRRWAAAIILGVMLGACGGGGGETAQDAGVEVLFPDLGGDDGLDVQVPDLGTPDPGPELPDTTGPCDDGARRCDGDDRVAVCQDSGWIVEACSTQCALKGVESLGCAGGLCTCADPQTGCDEGEATCQGSDTRAVCTDGAWKTSVCSVVCAEQGQASLGCAQGACSCGTPPQCLPGETRCQGANTVALCDEGQWLPTSCTVQCAEAGLSSAGCVDDACSCTDQPPVCDDGEATCETAEVVATCVGGQWQATPCAALCEGAGKDSHGCLGEACQCVDKPLCYVGDTQCVAATSQATCNGASWDLASCTDVCAAKGLIGDQCVGLACACSPAPDCSDGQVACDGASLLTCQGGTWSPKPCATACSEQGLLGGQCADGACACLGDQGAACPSCLTGACAGAAASCRASAPCAALTACLGGCGADAACTSACQAAHPTGLPGFSALLACVAGSCAGQCPDLPTCLEGQGRCASTNATEKCQGGTWVVGNCNETCYAQDLKSNGCTNGACACVFEPFDCEHGASGCPTPQSQATCQYGEWGPQASCATVCAAEGKVSQGCSAGACACEDPCTAGQKRCGDATTLQSCDVPPTWSNHNCESECTLKGLYSQGCGPVGASADCVCVDQCGQCQYQTCPAEKQACDSTNCLAWGDCYIGCQVAYWSCTFSCEYCYYCESDRAACEASCDAQYPGGADAYTALSPCRFGSCEAPCTN